MQSETRRFETVEAMENEIDELLLEGGSMISGCWKVDRQTDKGAALTYHAGIGNVWVHLILFILFGWWTFLLSNIVYAVAYYFINTRNLTMSVRKN
jgi:hypothetical protein